MRPDRNGNEIAETIHMGVTGHGRKREPAEIFGVKQIRRRNRRVLWENTEQMRGKYIILADRNQGFGRKEPFP